MDDMKIAAYRVFGFIAALGVWLYLMFVTRRTVLRIFGWTMAIFAVGFFFIHINIQSNMVHSRAVEPVRIVNDLRNLKSAAHMFYDGGNCA
ncbi:MAG: hypothetical protein LBG12_06585 [Synergistaceae bacterium]|jgi:hypothetical protein|nr:hypothetical protein [Synergistaceae bacterium]